MPRAARKAAGGNGAWGREDVRVAHCVATAGGGGKIISSLTIITTTSFPCISWLNFRTVSFSNDLVSISNGQCENTVILTLSDDFS